jgi:hypothetical protein
MSIGGVDELPQPSAAKLVTGILDDLQSLVRQQLCLTIREVELELQRRTRAGVVMSAGAGLLLVGAVTFSMAVANSLHWLTCPEGTDPAWFPLWACHAVVSLVFATAGGVALFVGRRMLQCST